MPVRNHEPALRILLYNERFVPDIGGVETVVSLLAHYLHDRGDHVVMATETPGVDADPNGCTVVRNPSPRMIRALVCETDVVHLHSFHARLLVEARRMRRPVVYTYHDLTPICPKGTKLEPDGPCLHAAGPLTCSSCLRASGTERPARKLVRPLLKSALSRLLDANVCVSEFARRRFPLSRAHCIPAGVDTQLLLPAGTPPPPEPARIAFVGRLVREKGCDVLLRAMHTCCEAGVPFELDVVGSGPERSALAALADQLGVAGRVRFRGDVVEARRADIVRSAHVAVVPSIWDEPFGLVAIEAASCGVPVVASEVGGLGELVAELGLGFARGDAGQLARRIEELLTNPTLRRQLGERGRRVAVERFDYRRMGSSYRQLYRELMQR